MPFKERNVSEYTFPDFHLIYSVLALPNIQFSITLSSLMTSLGITIHITSLLLQFSSQVLCDSSQKKPCNFPAVFAFGASSSDTGGSSAAFRQLQPPYGETFFHMPTGRYCDGRLILDFIASSLNLPYLNPYLNSIAANFSHGANFAAAGSTVRPQTTQNFGLVSPFSLVVQSLQFSQFKSRSILQSKKGGIFKDLLPSEDYFSRALYTFDIGQNDLTTSLYSNMSIDEVKAIIPDIIDNYKEVIQSVYNEGGRHFWIQNCPPFGCLPSVLQPLPKLAALKDKFGCGVLFNDLAQTFNEQLKNMVNHLRENLTQATFMYVDVYSAKYGLISEAQKHGFESELVACCGHGGEYNININCGTVNIINGTRYILGNSCRSPSTRIIWDGTHYTEAANKFVFKRLSGGAFSDPPLPVKMACRA